MREACRHVLTAVTVLAAVATLLSGQTALALVLMLAAALVSRLTFGKSLDDGARERLLRRLQAARQDRRGTAPVLGTAWSVAIFVEADSRYAPRTLALRDECSDGEWRAVQSALRLQRDLRSPERADDRVEGLPQTR